jgi:serine/threonine protein kinase
MSSRPPETQPSSAPTQPDGIDVPPPSGAPGLVLAGKYELVEEIGRGGMGVVWTAKHRNLGNRVAVKLMTPELARTQNGRVRFEREARTAARLRSQHIVRVFDYGVDEHTGSPYIVMELLEGQSLSHRLKQLTTLAPNEVSTIAKHLGLALADAHAAGVLHRDLKPDNVFLVRNGDEHHAKVLDFGLAKTCHPELLDSRAITVEFQIVGTPWYMSPEQIQGINVDDFRHDLWSLAVIVCQCLTGVHPFLAYDLPSLIQLLRSPQRPVPSQLREGAGLELKFDAWFAKATAPDIEDRFQNARELVQALETALDAIRSEPIPPLVHDELEPVRGSTIPPMARTHRPRRFFRLRSGLVALMVGLTSGLGIFYALWPRAAPIAPTAATVNALLPASPLPAPAASSELQTGGASSSTPQQQSVTAAPPPTVPALDGAAPAPTSLVRATPAAPSTTSRPATAPEARKRTRPSKPRTPSARPLGDVPLSDYDLTDLRKDI